MALPELVTRKNSGKTRPCHGPKIHVRARRGSGHANCTMGRSPRSGSGSTGAAGWRIDRTPGSLPRLMETRFRHPEHERRGNNPPHQMRQVRNEFPSRLLVVLRTRARSGRQGVWRNGRIPCRRFVTTVFRSDLPRTGAQRWGTPLRSGLRSQVACGPKRVSGPCADEVPLAGASP